jgi:hypothetical protein
MEFDNLVRAIEKEYKKSKEAFFAYAWRETVGSTLAIENKYSTLIDWINERICLNADIINIFNPADKTEQYTNGFFNTYRNACEELAMLLNFKEILLDDRCTVQMRENIEYAICKMFDMYYNEQLNNYVKGEK